MSADVSARIPSRTPSMKNNLVIRSISRNEMEAFCDLDQWAFAYDPDKNETFTQNFADSMDWDHVYGVCLQPDGPFVGSYGWLPFTLAVPGGKLPCAGVTAVGVHPLHRRQGCLRTMMHHHLAEAQETGQALSALFAAEPAIYGRFGYGAASLQMRMTLGRGAALRPAPSGTVPTLRMETVDIERHSDELAQCYEAWRLHRPGTIDRYCTAHRAAPLLDPPACREDAEPLKVLIAQGDGQEPARGYALFRRHLPHIGADGGTVTVQEFIARDPAAAHALWEILLDLDLMDRVKSPRLAIDDVLLHQLVDPRITSPKISDGLWLRIIDVPAAMTGRAYAAPIDTVLEVSDELIPTNAGRWHLKGGPQGSTCEKTQAPADVSLDVRELGSAYLGGHSLGAMAAAGLVTELTPGALAPASLALGWPVAPFSPSCF